MIVLTLEPGEAEKLAAGAPGQERCYGMPIDPAPRVRAMLGGLLDDPELIAAAARDADLGAASPLTSGVLRQSRC